MMDGGLDQPGRVRVHSLDETAAMARMPFYLAALLIGQRPGVTEDGGRDADQADVVQERGQDRLLQASLPVRIGQGQASDDLGHGQAMAGDETRRIRWISREETQRRFLPRLVENLIG